jgi:hypothetical protein
MVHIFYGTLALCDTSSDRWPRPRGERILPLRTVISSDGPNVCLGCLDKLRLNPISQEQETCDDGNGLSAIAHS